MPGSITKAWLMLPFTQSTELDNLSLHVGVPFISYILVLVGIDFYIMFIQKAMK